MVAGDGSPSAGSTDVAWKQLQEHASIFALDEEVICMVTTRPPKTIVKPTALGPVANTDTKLLIYGLFRKGRVLAQDGEPESPTSPPTRLRTGARHKSMTIETARRASLEFVCVFGQDGLPMVET